MIEAGLGTDLLKLKVGDLKTMAQEFGATTAAFESSGEDEQSTDVQSVSEAESQSVRSLSQGQDSENMDLQPVSDAGFQGSRSSLIKSKHIAQVGSVATSASMAIATQAFATLLIVLL
jgi:hypothetical protein